MIICHLDENGSRLLKQAVGYKSPEKQRICKNCYSCGEAKVQGDNSYYAYFMPRSNIPATTVLCCSYLEGLFFNKTKKSLIFEVDPEGTCNCFKKQPVRCPRYNHECCSHRKCTDPKYDDNCMEIV